MGAIPACVSQSNPRHIWEVTCGLHADHKVTSMPLPKQAHLEFLCSIGSHSSGESENFVNFTFSVSIGKPFRTVTQACGVRRLRVNWTLEKCKFLQRKTREEVVQRRKSCT